jgi:SAM-dependent methyltransferase
MITPFLDEASYFRDKNNRDRETRFWGTRAGQNARFSAILRHMPFKGARILDVGCGTGDFLTFAIEQGVAPERYIGIDILPEFIDEARGRALPGGEFHALDVLAPDWVPPPNIDFVVANGLFALKQPDDGWWSRYRLITERFWSWALKGVAYTLVSRHSTGNSAETQYCDPGEILNDAAARFGPWTVIDHSYLINDFVIAAFKSSR